MSMRRRKPVPGRLIELLLPAAVLCIVCVPLLAEETPPQDGDAGQAAQIKAELAALRQELATLQAESAEFGTAPSAQGGGAESQEPETDSAEAMPVEEYVPIETGTSGSLTNTSPRLMPYTMTTITREQIQTSQARSLYELLEFYVPNFQMLFASENPKALGLRGIISHRSNKLLLLVNGRIMNEQTDFGVMMEVDLPMLTDIHHIDVVRGPSSALYGPNAQSMTINIVTESAATFQGDQVTIRGGGIEEFETLEYKYGRKLDPMSGIFFYAGVSQYNGADPSDSPTVFGSREPMWLRGNGPAYQWTQYPGDKYVKGWFKNLNETPFDRPKMKMYGQYNYGGFNIWGRYTEGGQWIDFTQWWEESRYSSDEGLSYTQATVQASYDQEVNADFSIRYVLSFDEFTNENENYDRALFWKSFSEDEFYGNVTARWTPHENHSVAFGGLWSHEEFGKRFEGTPISNPSFTWAYPPSYGWMPRWDTDSYAVFGEYQWNISDQFTLFTSGRVDWHPFTETMYSPRGVLIYTPTEKDTVKLMASRSVVHNTAAQMWIDNSWAGVRSPIEKLDAYELRYERQQNDRLWFGGSVFLYNFDDALAEVPNENTGTNILGDIKTWGFELEAGYHTDKLRIDVSHSYTKLRDLTLNPDTTWWNQYSAEPYGFGDDLAQWHNQTTKLRAEYAVSDKLTLNGALCVLWGNPGGQDWAEYRNSIFPNWDYKLGFDEPFKPSAYLNLGMEYKWNENLTLNLTGYNLLGWIDKELNKRRVGFDDQLPGHYRIQPMAFSGSLTYKF